MSRKPDKRSILEALHAALETLLVHCDCESDGGYVRLKMFGGNGKRITMLQAVGQFTSFDSRGSEPEPPKLTDCFVVPFVGL